MFYFERRRGDRVVILSHRIVDQVTLSRLMCLRCNRVAMEGDTHLKGYSQDLS